jgi:hypothetical protein
MIWACLFRKRNNDQYWPIINIIIHFFKKYMEIFFRENFTQGTGSFHRNSPGFKSS